MYKEAQLIRDAVGRVIPQYFDGSNFQPLDNTRDVKAVPFKDIIEINEVATTSNQIVSNLGLRYINHISNDGDVTLRIGFNSASTGTNKRVTLQAGEVISDLNIEVNAVHFSTTDGTCRFRVVGVR